jgi:ABC-type transport system substrate-binding protein
MTIGRRGLLGGLAAAGVLSCDLAQGTPNTNLRIGMTASAVPLPNGMPDQGTEGHRFMGITLYDHLVAWEFSVSDKPAPLRPGLATEWRTDPADLKRWIFTIRDGVEFPDGKVLDAEDIAFSYDRCFKNDPPHYDARFRPGAQPDQHGEVNPRPALSRARVQRSGSQISKVCGAGAGSKPRKSWIAQPRPSRPASRAAEAASSAWK